MELLPKQIRAQLPPLYSTEDDKDPVVICKLFAPWNKWTLPVTEFDGEDILFGWVYSDFPEYGYSSLSEIASAQGPWGMRIERDIFFQPCKMSVAQAELLPSNEEIVSM